MKLDSVAVEAPSVVSFDWGDFGDKRSPNPLVNLANADFSVFSTAESFPVEANGWGIFKFLAHVDIPEAESFDATPLGESSLPASTAGGGGGWPSGIVPAAGKLGDSADDIVSILI